MRSRRWRKGFVVGLVVVFAAALAGGAFADQSYPDARGDAGVGYRHHRYDRHERRKRWDRLQVGAATPLVANHAFMIFIDADKNQSTGRSG